MIRVFSVVLLVGLTEHGVQARDMRDKKTKAPTMPPAPPLCSFCADGSDPGVLGEEPFGTLALGTNSPLFSRDLCFDDAVSCASLADQMSQLTPFEVETGTCAGYQEVAFQLGCGCPTGPVKTCDLCDLFGGTPDYLNDDG